MLYRNMEATASFTCIIHTVVRRWTLNKGVVPVRFMFYTHWQECTTDINIDITRLAVIVECILSQGHKLRILQDCRIYPSEAREYDWGEMGMLLQATHVAI